MFNRTKKIKILLFSMLHCTGIPSLILVLMIVWMSMLWWFKEIFLNLIKYVFVLWLKIRVSQLVNNHKGLSYQTLAGRTLPIQYLVRCYLQHICWHKTFLMFQKMRPFNTRKGQSHALHFQGLLRKWNIYFCITIIAVHSLEVDSCGQNSCGAIVYSNDNLKPIFFT